MRLGGLQKTSLIDYPGKVCAIVFTIGCNFRCPYCHNPELVDCTASEISEDEFFAFLKKRQGLLDAVTITGGEPTLHHDIIPFIKSIKELGFLVKLDSNGTNPKVLQEVIDNQLVDYIAMDIKSPLHKYPVTVNRMLNIGDIETSIKLLLEGRVNYEFRTTVVKDMLEPEDFEEIGQLIKGAKNYYLQKFIPSKPLDLNYLEKTTYSDDEFKDLQSIMEKHVETCEIR